MSDEEARLDEYRTYYRARAARFAAQPDYPATAAAEARLAEAVEQATSMADLQQRVLGDGLALECGRALAGDQARARAALFARTKEDVRAQEPAEVLAGLDAVTDAAALASLGSGAAQRNVQAVTADEHHRIWTLSLLALENVETWRTARVPDRWRVELDGWAEDALVGERQVWQEAVAAGNQQQPGWRFDEAVARAPRHRRLVPLPDDVLDVRLAEHARGIRGEAG